MTIDPTGSTWKCPQCGQIDDLKDERCPRCRTANAYWNADTVGHRGTRSAKRSADPVILLVGVIVMWAFALWFGVAAREAVYHYGPEAVLDRGRADSLGITLGAGLNRADALTDVSTILWVVGAGVLIFGLALLADKRRMRRA